MVKRYDVIGDATMFDVEDGGWVRYEDYERDMKAVLVKALENMSMFKEALNVDDKETD